MDYFSSGASSEPAGEAETVVCGGKDFVRKCVAAKQHERAARGRNGDQWAAAIRVVEHERPAPRWIPHRVEVKHNGNHAGITVAVAINVAGVLPAWGIVRVVQFGVIEIEEKLRVQMREQRMRECVRRNVGDFATRGFNPVDVVASKVCAQCAGGRAPDASTSHFALCGERLQSRPPIRNLRRRYEIGQNDETIARKRIGNLYNRVVKAER